MRQTIMGISMALLSAAAASGGRCTADIPLVWEIRALYVDGTTPNLVTGDGSVYRHGESGVESVIQVCAGSNGAVLWASTQRSVSVTLTKPLATNARTPANSTISGNWFLNVHNITFVPTGKTRSDEYSFTTRYGSMAPDRSTYVRMFNPAVQAVTITPHPSSNDPYLNSPVNVYHCPENSTATTGLCVGVTKETWFVWPDEAVTEPGASQTGLPKTQVASLVTSFRGKDVASGEFSVPFYYVISIK